MMIPIPQNDEQKIKAIQLYRSPRIGPNNFRKLMGGQDSFNTAMDQLAEVIKSQSIKSYCPADVDDAAIEFEAGQNFGARIIFDGEEKYPKLLRECSARPPFIWVKGDENALRTEGVAIVGSRHASINGVRMARMLARDLSKSGLPVVSGMARGIDTAAHEGALAQTTIAVLAGGLDIAYPAQNRSLQENIGERGLLISEMPFGHQPQASNFPQRNRIIAALSRAGIVVECGIKSGTMITANRFLALGRDVMAVPAHPFEGRSSGPSYLIRDGALLIRDALDVLEALGEKERRTIPDAPPVTASPEPKSEGSDWAKMGYAEIYKTAQS